MPLEESDSRLYVWYGVLDDRFRVTVTRMSADKGKLEILDMETRQIIFTEEVPLYYSAKFGPDYSDVRYWTEVSIGEADSYLRKREEG